mgnify:FL=1
MSDILKEYNAIMRKKDIVVAKIAAQLYRELITITPVAKGELKSDWQLQKDGSSWIISNNMEYAEIRLSPLIEDNGKAIVGSFKYPLGIQPTIEKYNIKLQKELKAI